MHAHDQIELRQGDALVIVDVQNDFLPGGALAVPRGDEVISSLNRYIDRFQSQQLPIIATRDWHPGKHCSFKPEGGIWPVHCVANTEGAAFSRGLRLPESTVVISKADSIENESYSGFGNTGLAARLKEQKVKRLFIGGLATDYCVLNTVLDGLKNNFQVFLLCDASRAVNIHPNDGAKAEAEMTQNGAVPINLDRISI